MDVGALLSQITQPTLVTRIEPYFVPARASQRVAAEDTGIGVPDSTPIQPSCTRLI